MRGDRQSNNRTTPDSSPAFVAKCSHRASINWDTRMYKPWHKRPFRMQKMEQLLRLVRESHEQPIAGTSRPVQARRPRRSRHHLHRPLLFPFADRRAQSAGRSGLLQATDRAAPPAPPGIAVDELPPIDLVLLTHAHMDHLDLASLRRVIRATRRLSGRTPEVVVPRGVEDLVEDWASPRSTGWSGGSHQPCRA